MDEEGKRRSEEEETSIDTIPAGAGVRGDGPP